MSEDSLNFIPTRASSLKRKPEEEFISLDYKSYKPKEKSIKTPVINKNNDDDLKSANIFNIKKARHEVLQFGISGFNAKEKEEARIELAIKLGAKPERKKYVNYKQLKDQQITQKKSEKSVVDFQQLGKNKLGKSTAKGKSFDKKRKNKSDILDIYGTVKNNPAIMNKNSKRTKRK